MRITHYATFAIPGFSGSLSHSESVRLIGLRGQPDQPNLDVLSNRAWPIEKIDGNSITLNLQEVAIETVGDYSLLAGVWYISETHAGLSSEDHDTVPYLNEVERAIVRTSGWLRVIGIDENVVKFEPVEPVVGDAPIRGVPDGNHRIVIRMGDQDQPVVDLGTERVYGEADNALSLIHI